MDSKFELATCILGPLVSSILLLQFVYWALNNHNTAKSSTYKKLRVFTLDADRGLAEQGYLWLSIITPIVYFIVFGSLAWSDYSISLTSDGFKKFIDISTLPLALLSLSIPMTVLIARIHATHQTSVQIATTRHKNNMDAYYAHRKAMFEYFGSLNKIQYPGKIEGDFHAHPRLHLRFFIDKGPSHGTPEVNVEQFKQAINTISDIQTHIHTALTSNTNRMEVIENYAQACNKIFKLSSTLHLPCIYEDLRIKQTEHRICRDSSHPAEDDLQFTPVGKNTEQLIGAYRYTRSFLRVLCEFAGHEVYFFDKKQYPLIDKGESYKNHPYNIVDIGRLLSIAQDASDRLITERRIRNEQIERLNTFTSA